MCCFSRPHTDVDCVCAHTHRKYNLSAGRAEGSRGRGRQPGAVGHWVGCFVSTVPRSYNWDCCVLQRVVEEINKPTTQ